MLRQAKHFQVLVVISTVWEWLGYLVIDLCLTTQFSTVLCSFVLKLQL